MGRIEDSRMSSRMSLPDPFQDEKDKEEERMKDRTEIVVGHIVIFVVSVMAGFFGWWNFGFYFGALIVVLAALLADIIEEACGKNSAWFVIPAVAGHIVYWLILAYVLRGLWEPFGGLLG